MLRVTIDVNAPAGLSLAVKEQLAMILERYGDTRVVAVEAVDGGPKGGTGLIGNEYSTHQRAKRWVSGTP